MMLKTFSSVRGNRGGLALDDFLEEVASYSYSIRQSMDALSLKTLWNTLARFLWTSLRAHKGVVLPGLGTFHVGLAQLDSQRCSDYVVPAFQLLKGRFVGISYEVIRMRPAGRRETVLVRNPRPSRDSYFATSKSDSSPLFVFAHKTNSTLFCDILEKGSVVPPNYHLLSKEVHKHRSACQRLVKDMCQCIAAHIAAGHAMNIPFPAVGNLVTNRVGRVQFKFEKDLLALLKNHPNPVRPATSASTRNLSIEESTQVSNSAGTNPICGSYPNPVPLPEDEANQTMRGLPLNREESGKNSNMRKNNWTAAFSEIRSLCNTKDRARSGCICRIQMEQWLQNEGRTLASAVNAATLLDLLQVHSYGKTGKFLMYETFLEGLWETLEELKELKIIQGKQGSKVDVLEVETPPNDRSKMPSPEPEQVEPEIVKAQEVDNFLEQNRHCEFEEGIPGDQVANMKPLLCDQSAPTDQELYFMQNFHRKLSRSACDKFNRHHYQRILSSRGGTQKLPPKVGEEPLTVEEANLMRSDSPVKCLPQSIEEPVVAKEDRRQRGMGVGPGREIVSELLGEAQNGSVRREKELEMNKIRDTRQFLRQSWSEQARERAKIKELFQSAEGHWPYIPAHNPYDRLPITSPPYIAPHYVRSLNAPSQQNHMTNGGSLWSGL